MEVEGVGEGKDFKLWPGGGRDWDWSEFGTAHGSGIQAAEVDDLIAHGCNVVILTKGRLGRLKVQEETIRILEKKGSTY